MKKQLFLLLLTAIFSFGNDINSTTEINKSTFIGDLMEEVSSTLDANITDKVKLENLKSYITSLQFDDKVDNEKYKFNLMGYNETYIFLGGYSPTKLYEKEWSDAYTSTNKYQRDKNEAQFQISFKLPLYKNFLNSKGDLFTAYTQNSYWQVYNTEYSSPFRETNYQPELFVEWHNDKKFGDSKLIQSKLALIHQSNGQDVGQSRSWNRTELSFLFQNDNFYYGTNIWDRWDEKGKTDANATTGDDNPDLENLIGNQKYFVKYKGDKISITLAHQNDILNYDINKGNTKIDFSFPSPNKNFDFFVRYFNGYGESLVDYNIKIERISFGILIADWI
ncbi:MAG: phospholipase A [Arcobacteraceae bacterium]|jgi:phospholipase A1|nr:phospholipase A [Arcobacteraceae bacterium]